MCDMAVQSGYTTYPRREEEVLGGEAIPQHPINNTPGPFPCSEPTLDGAVEPWMDGILNEDLISSLPLNWENVLDSCLDMDSTQATTAEHNSATLPALATEKYDSLLGNTSTSATDEFLNEFTDSNSFFDAHPALPNAQSNFPIHSSELPSNSGFGMENTFEQFDLPSSASASPIQDGDHSQLVFNQVAAAFKDLSRARAAADPRPLSRKQKQRDASIALYLERLRDTCNEAVAVLGASNNSDDAQNNPMHPNQTSGNLNLGQIPMSWQQSSTSGSSFSSGYDVNVVSGSSSPSDSFTEYSPRSLSSQPPTFSSNQSPDQQSPAPAAGGVELVMDLNMNTATSLPRKHRPRTQAQRQRYLAVRNHGACEKHKKQHKRCTCIDQTVSTTSLQQRRSAESGVHTGPYPASSASNAVLPKSESNRVENHPLCDKRPGYAFKLCSGGLPPMSSSGCDGSRLYAQSGHNKCLSTDRDISCIDRRPGTDKCRLSTNRESYRQPKVDDGCHTMACTPSLARSSRAQSPSTGVNIRLECRSKIKTCTTRLFCSPPRSPTSTATSNICACNRSMNPSGVTRPSSNTSYNTDSNSTPLKHCHSPLDEDQLLHTPPPAPRNISSVPGSRLNFQLSPHQQRQQCNHNNSTYGTTQQPANSSHVQTAGNQKLQTQLSLRENAPGNDHKSISCFSSVYHGFLCLCRAYNLLRQDPKTGDQRRTFAAWCLIWIMLLALSSVTRGLYR